MLAFMVAGQNGDPSRIISQILTGIGFLGAGAIFKANDKVRGLTTAAFIWVVAALGIMIGLGFSLTAIVLAAGMVLMVEILTFIEKRLSPAPPTPTEWQKIG
jgi:putative Mg2+ transporter-C (MgtC) family protein